MLGTYTQTSFSALMQKTLSKRNQALYFWSIMKTSAFIFNMNSLLLIVARWGGLSVLGFGSWLFVFGLLFGFFMVGRFWGWFSVLLLFLFCVYLSTLFIIFVHLYFSHFSVCHLLLPDMHLIVVYIFSSIRAR